MKNVDKLLKLAEKFERKMIMDVKLTKKAQDSGAITLTVRPIFNNFLNTFEAQKKLSDVLQYAVDKAWEKEENFAGSLSLGGKTKLIVNKINNKWVIDRVNSKVQLTGDINHPYIRPNLDKMMNAFYTSVFPIVETELNRVFGTASFDKIDHDGNMSSVDVQT